MKTLISSVFVLMLLVGGCVPRTQNVLTYTSSEGRVLVVTGAITNVELKQGGIKIVGYPNDPSAADDKTFYSTAGTTTYKLTLQNRAPEEK
jgi:hypothetical protein